MRTIFIILITFASLNLLTACNRHAEKTEASKPAMIVRIPDSQYNQVTLSETAAHRIGLELTAIKPSQTADVQTNKLSNVIIHQPTQNATFTEVPYSAIIYGIHGETWIYMLVKPLTFMRTEVTIDHIAGDVAVLSASPPINTQIVSVGVTELYGSEYIGNIEP